VAGSPFRQGPSVKDGSNRKSCRKMRDYNQQHVSTRKPRTGMQRTSLGSQEGRSPRSTVTTETCHLVKSVRKCRMKWVATSSERKMLMRIQKPYEEGSILLDAPQHDTMDKLARRVLYKDLGGMAGDSECHLPSHLPCKTIDYSNAREIGIPVSKKTAGAAKCAPPPPQPQARVLQGLITHLGDGRVTY